MSIKSGLTKIRFSPSKNGAISNLHQKSIKILIKNLLIWYMVGLCRFNISWIFGIWKMKHFLHLKTINILFLTLSFFYVSVYISFNFQRTKTQYIPNYCKCCEESAELNRFTLADLERELQPRKPVHFFFALPLVIGGHKDTMVGKAV